MFTAFQSNAFQCNAFQINGRAKIRGGHYPALEKKRKRWLDAKKRLDDRYYRALEVQDSPVKERIEEFAAPFVIKTEAGSETNFERIYFDPVANRKFAELIRRLEWESENYLRIRDEEEIQMLMMMGVL